uniref:Methyltransf_11 domain-containing protein n=2 Tax=Caenorhabditis tropicalis TaxID=1561998 RepID=A0A1I7U4X4_9PELO
MESNSQYARMDYWDERFQTEKKFEWLSGLEAFQHIVCPLISKDSRIAHIGCGSSQVSMQLYDLGYKNITNVDYSQVLIENGKLEHPYMEWIADDITSLENLADDSYDVVLEKATIEAILVTEKSAWEPSDSALRSLESIFSSISRVLKPGGVFISISFTQPHFRIPALLREKSWSIEMFEFGETFHYYVYVCRKGGKTDGNLAERYSAIAKSWLRPLC